MGKKRKKTHTQLPGFGLALLRQLLATRAGNLTKQLKKQNTCARSVSSLNIMSRSRNPPFEKETLLTRLQIQIQVKRNCKVNRANIFAEKIKVEGSVTFQNIFSSIMADFRAVVWVLPCSSTNKGRKNLFGCAEKSNR